MKTHNTQQPSANKELTQKCHECTRLEQKVADLKKHYNQKLEEMEIKYGEQIEYVFKLKKYEIVDAGENLFD